MDFLTEEVISYGLLDALVVTHSEYLDCQAHGILIRLKMYVNWWVNEDFFCIRQKSLKCRTEEVGLDLTVIISGGIDTQLYDINRQIATVVSGLLTSASRDYFLWK